MLQIRWTKSALHKQERILKFWINHNSSDAYSKKLKEEINLKEKQICKYPEMGSNSEIRNVKYVLILKHFSLFYRVKLDFIEVVAFWDNRRNPNNLEIDK